MSETLTQQNQGQAVSVQEQLQSPEIQQALSELVGNLPKLAELSTLLVKAYDVANTVAKDPVLMNDMVHGTADFVKPIVGKAKGIAAAAIEANDRAQASDAQIGLMGMLKMLKDPQVQQGLRFAQAFLDVTAANKQK